MGNAGDDPQRVLPDLGQNFVAVTHRTGRPSGRRVVPEGLVVAIWSFTLGVGSLSFNVKNLDSIGVDRVASIFLVALTVASTLTIASSRSSTGRATPGTKTQVGVIALWAALPAIYAGLMIACRVLPGDLGWIFGVAAVASIWLVGSMAGILGLAAGLVALFHERCLRRSLSLLLAGSIWLGTGFEVGRPRIDLSWEGAAQRQCWRFQLQVDRAVKQYGASGRKQALPVDFDAACDRLVAVGLLPRKDGHMNDEKAWPGVTKFWTLTEKGSVCVVHGPGVDLAASLLPGWRKLLSALPGRRLNW